MTPTKFNWFPGHMNKALKSIAAKLPAIDLVIEIVDARAPQSSINETLHQLLGEKPLLTLLSKGDWADPEITQQWLKWYQKQKRAVALLDYQSHDFSSRLVKQINAALASKYERWKARGIISPQINVLVIGVPNVGKSTFINHLLKKHKAITANRPGVTRGLQIIQLTPTINLIDTPGVLPARLTDWTTATNLVAINSIKQTVYPVSEIAFSLAERLYPRYARHFHDYYRLSPKSIDISQNAQVLFEAIARAKKNEINPTFDWERKVFYPFLEDLANGKLKISFEWPK